MSISAVAATTATPGVAPVASTSVSSTSGGGVTYGLGAGAAGGYVAQGPGAGSLIKKMVIGGVIGAGVGFGASFLSLPVIGGLAAPVVAAIGAGVGAVAGLGLHLLSKRKANLAMEQAQAQQLAAMQQSNTVMTPTAGTTLRVGSKGGATRTLQTNLKALGLYQREVSGTYDKATANAVRRFELMKGVQPTGLATPDLRTAVEQDSALARQLLV